MKQVLPVAKRVFRHRRYMLWATGVALLVVSAGTLLPNLDALGAVWSSSAVSVSFKLAFLFSLYGSLFSNFTVLSMIYLLLTAVLFGINIAFLTFYIRRRRGKGPNVTAPLASLGGLVASMFGIGCAACGSVIITAVLSIFGGAGLLLMLPFHGAEFGLIGLVLLLVSISYLAKRIEDPLTCPAKC
jgi:hypothetical protein